MIFHENRLLADDSHEISYLIFIRKFGKMLKNVSSVAVVIDALRVKTSIEQLVPVFESLQTFLVSLTSCP